MDWGLKLAADTMDQLQQRARNAAAIIAAHPDSAKATAAEELLASISLERDRRGISGNIDTFLAKYTRGFEDPLYIKEERKDKLAASEACKEALGPSAFSGVASGNTAEVISAVRRLVNMTNLIQGSFEKPKLLDAISDSKNEDRFCHELDVLLHGNGDAPERLEVFSDYMETIGLRKWTYGTYFLFLNDPVNCMFVKPEGLKKAIEIAGYPLDYDPAPSASVYRQVLEFAGWIDSRLKARGQPDLVPKDMIDTQSFIWHMAPTGKFAKS